ncbi:NAD(P)/FAD-dependent oxidoreductase [Dactylosporangium sp. NPDC005555]|uniref:NAD(P)/FAD-dependent oxidoreductase n=1 Tax=Dactylosporangium sp. NPDC005555 TaxID=3154889 RepID=UPI0033BE477C
MDNAYDVAIIGGGAAGLSAALTLSRARRRVLVIDAGEPRNAPAGHVHNYLGRENTPPGELLSTGRAEVSSYGGEIRDDVVTAVTGAVPHFTLSMAGGGTVSARRVLVTTGLVDELPDIPGVAEHWGSRVLHCPYCHGWEVRDRPVAILATTSMAAHQALLWRQWTPDVVLLLHTAPSPSPEELARLERRGIKLVSGEVVAYGQSGAELADGTLVPVDALVLMSRIAARVSALEPLGLSPVPFEANGIPLGTHVPSGLGGATSVPGVFVAGNVTDPMATVIAAAAAGVSAGGFINMDLVLEEAAG